MSKTNGLSDEPISQAFYRAYKPFRNGLRKLGLEESLQVIWLYAAHISGNVMLPPRFHGLDKHGKEFDIREYVGLWELALLAREVLLNASKVGDASLSQLPVLRRMMNGIKSLSSFDSESIDWQQLMLHMHRLAHQQFPVQRGVQVADLMRHKLIFEHPGMKDVFEKGVGLSPQVFYFLGFSVEGAVRNRPRFVTSSDYTSFGISDEERDLFFSRLVAPTSVLKARIVEFQRFGRAWAFTVNPLESTPLISIDPAFPDRAYCPIPSTVLRRITSGAYYDLVGVDGFEQGFGSAFEDYIGLVMRKSCAKAKPWEIHKPKPYRVAKKQTHHGVDWILTDGTANLFIECKVARITAAAVAAETHADIEPTVRRLAKMIVQNYSNIYEALSGATDWNVNGLPSFSLIVTLEDFIPFGEAVAKPVREKVVGALRAKRLPEGLVDDVPYCLLSAAEFEGLCAVLSEFSAFDLFTQKNRDECSQWLFSAFLRQPEYHDIYSRARMLHADDYLAFWKQVDQMSGGQFSIRRPDGPPRD